MTPLRIKAAIIGLLALALLTSSCNLLKPTSSSDLPPILAQDEVIRPYVKLGKILITREIYGADYALTPDIHEWGINAIRQEAARMGADAVMLPEISGGHANTYLVIPTTEYRASGVAIKFK